MIESHLRFRPFSREIPTLVPIPGTGFGAKIFPARLEIFSLHDQKPVFEKEFSFGPIDQFLVTLNLERGAVEVSGFVGKKPIRYEIKNNALGILKDTTIPFAEETLFDFSRRERLSLGSNKAQDVTMMHRRGDLEELVPFWYFLAQSFPPTRDIPETAPSLFRELEETALKCDKNLLAEKLLNVLRVGFTSLFFPRVHDDSHLGYPLPLFAIEKGASPLLFLQKTFPLLRSLFFQETPDACELLPLLPPQFHAGRLIGMKTARGHSLSIEWTKKAPRRIFFVAASDDRFAIKFPSAIKRFRFQPLDRAPCILQNGSEIIFEAGIRYLIDRFER